MSNFAPVLIVLTILAFLVLGLTPARHPRKPPAKKPARRRVTRKSRR